MDVGGTEAELAGPGLEDDALGAIEALQLLGDLEGAIWGGVVDDNQFPV